jgi:hypothetical protein
MTHAPSALAGSVREQRPEDPTANRCPLRLKTL